MKVLVIGKGGREHTILWKIAQNPSVDKIYCIPGNGGISHIAECVPIKEMDKDGILAFCKISSVDLVVVAPDDPLVAGLVDFLEDAGVRAFGPRKNAAILEGSKSFSKDFMIKYGIPTAKYEVFDDSELAIRYLENQKYPIVIKADGLALGKGVVIATDLNQAVETINNMMKNKVFGNSGSRVVIEEFLTGREVSLLAFTDGKTIAPMVSSQDYKKVLDNNLGLNTGGMGSVSPSKIYTKELAELCMKDIYIPTINGMNKENRTFKGVLYFGLMVTNDGPRLLEYNARFGDPETQVVLPRIKNDIIDVFNSVIDEKLDTIKFEWNERASVCVVLASGGYPQNYTTGYEIEGLNEINNAMVFHSGTEYKNGCFYTNGGRVLGITAMGDSVKEARDTAYAAVDKVKFKHMHYRQDIAKDNI